MARAPVGSCPNDPTQPRCPTATRVVESPTVELGDGAVAFAPGPAATATRRARAAQWPWQCQLRLSDASPYKAAGYAQMNNLSDLLCGGEDELFPIQCPLLRQGSRHVGRGS
jgi:hypothetical protein